MTQQPNWKFIGHIGDVDPITYGGGFVYTDATGVYAPEMTWFEPAPDEQWHETESDTPLQEYRIMLEKEPQSEWWYSRLTDIASFTGLEVEELRAMSLSRNPLEVALLYSYLIHYFGAEEFDSYPMTLTENEAYVKYAEEMKHRNVSTS